PNQQVPPSLGAPAGQPTVGHSPCKTVATALAEASLLARQIADQLTHSRRRPWPSVRISAHAAP
ncbi:MAG TPA: hypothetical protein VE673_14225, partial [Pseudonocardiaceae bacterium]|nr:hypothetical protein [Pseudonocardiaceae bacterium]